MFDIVDKGTLGGHMDKIKNIETRLLWKEIYRFKEDGKWVYGEWTTNRNSAISQSELKALLSKLIRLPFEMHSVDLFEIPADFEFKEQCEE